MSSDLLAVALAAFRESWRADRSAYPAMAVADLRRLALRSLLAELRQAEPATAALAALEAIEADLAAQFEVLAEQARQEAQRADYAEAVRQAGLAEADGGSSDLTISAWLESVAVWAARVGGSSECEPGPTNE